MEIKYFYHREIGIDLGNGLIKVRAVLENGEIYRLNMPSAFLRKEDIGVSVNKTADIHDFYELNGSSYAWGTAISTNKAIVSSHGHENRYVTKAFKTMAKIVLARVFYELDIRPDEKVLVVTGVPSNQTGTKAEHDIREAFLGNFTMNINGEPVEVKVDEVEVMSQPVATVVGRYLDEDGLVGNDAYERMTVAVVDIGGGTTDLDVVECLNRKGGYHSIPVGFHDVYDNIRKHIDTVYSNSNPTDYELLSIIQEYDATDKPLIYKPNMRVEGIDIRQAFLKGIDDLAIETQSAITTKWKNQRSFDEVLLVGGSAHLIQPEIKDVAVGIVVPDNNGESNVEGYFRFARYRSIMKAQEEIQKQVLKG